MSARINSVLESIREQVEQDGWVPDADGGAAAGVGSATNPTDAGANDAIDLYLSEIEDICGLEYDLDSDAAVALIYDTADMMGIEIPDETSPDSEAALWLGKAKTVAFAQAVLKRACDMAHAPEEPPPPEAVAPAAPEAETAPEEPPAEEPPMGESRTLRPVAEARMRQLLGQMKRVA